MIHLFLDTSILRQDPRRRKAGFKSLERLARLEHVLIHVSDIVRREFVSQQIEQYDEHISKISSGLSGLKRKPLPNQLISELGLFNNTFDVLRSQVYTFLEEDFNSWAQLHHVEIHQIQQNHATRVIQSYFEGQPPFKSKKNRLDIPDAFIWQVALDLLEEVDSLYIVVADGAILDACNNIATITAFASIDDFIVSDVCAPLLKEANTTENVEKVLKLLKADQRVLISMIEHVLDTGLNGEQVISSAIPDDNSEGRIWGASNFEGITAKLNEIQYYGDGVFIIPFHTKSDAEITYALFKGDYYSLDEKRINHISISDLNDHYVDAEETFPIVVSGLLSVTVTLEELAKGELEDNILQQIIAESEYDLDSVTNIEVDEEVFYRRLHGDPDDVITINIEAARKLQESLESISTMHNVNELLEPIKRMLEVQTGDFAVKQPNTIIIERFREQILSINTEAISEVIGSIESLIAKPSSEITETVRSINMEALEGIRNTLRSVDLSAITNAQNLFRTFYPPSNAGVEDSNNQSEEPIDL